MSRALIVAGGIGGALLAGGTWVLVWAFRDGNRRLNKALDEAADPGVDIFDAHAATAMALLTPDTDDLPIGPAREWCDLTVLEEVAFSDLAAECPELGGAA